MEFKRFLNLSDVRRTGHQTVQYAQKNAEKNITETTQVRLADLEYIIHNHGNTRCEYQTHLGLRYTSNLLLGYWIE